MPFEDPRSALESIVQAIASIGRFTRDLDLGSYSSDEKTQAAVERKLLIISEAAVRMRDRAEDLCPGLPWNEIRGIGNWLRHAYDRVEIETVWHTIQDDLPVLQRAVERALRKLSEPS